MGKTALVLKAAYDVLDQPTRPFDAVVWVSSKTKQLTNQNIVDIKDAISDSLGVLQSIATELSGLNPADALAQLRDYLQTFKVLIIIDNLETILDDRIRSFLRNIPAGTKVLITSRIGLGELEHRVKLEPMDDHDAVHLLRTLAGVRRIRSIEQTSKKVLATYVQKMHNNPGHIRWFISVVQAGKRPEEALARPDMFLQFCMSNVYEYLARNSRAVLDTLLTVSGSRTQAELAFLSSMDAMQVQSAVHELLSTNMLIMSSIHSGNSFESKYELSEIAREYLARYRPTSKERAREIIKRRQQLTANTERLAAGQRDDPYSIFSIRIRSQSDQIVAKYLLDALLAVRRGRLELAEKHVETAKNLAPAYFEVYRVEVWVRAEQGTYAAARLAYEAAVELEPASAPLRLFFAHCCPKQDRVVMLSVENEGFGN